MIRCNTNKQATNTTIPSLSLSLIWKLLIAGAAAVAMASLLGDKEFSANKHKSDVNSSRSLSANSIRSLSQQQPIHPNLPFGDINIMVVSDVHSFVGGHPHEPNKNADYGDLYSFHERLKTHCDSNETDMTGDLWLFNNGDILHGTGLAMDGNATNLLPIVNALPWDAMTMGRQEATYSDVLRDMKSSLPVPNNSNDQSENENENESENNNQSYYVTSNVVWSETKEPYGERYKLLKGKSSTLLVFGFLYDTVRSSETIEVLPIEQIVREEWFRTALKQETNSNNYHYDAIVVMAHMDIDSPLIHTLHQEIRLLVDSQMPIQFLAGHSHKRAASNAIQKDHYVHKMEPGGLFDTIGWVTIPKFETAKQFPTRGNFKELEKVFSQEFIDTGKDVLHSRLGLAEEEELLTNEGARISELIRETREGLGLDQIVACPGHDYMRNISIFDSNSLWKLWRDHVVRTEIFQKDEDRVMLVSKSTFRYDLKGSGKHDAMTLDDVVAIAPYMEKVVYVGEVPDWMIRRMNNTFNTFSHHNIIPDYVLAGDLDEVKTAESYKLYTHEVDVPKIKSKLEKFNFHDFVLEYTGQRDTLYWLDYVRSAMPCSGKQKQTFEVPYFYDPSELEEEATDGKLTSEDLEIGGEGGSNEALAQDEETWTLPPNGDYQGYVPGKGSSTEVTSAVYENYKSKDQIEEDARKKKAAEVAKIRGSGDFTSQLNERKKTRKKVIKGFALTFGGAVLMVPVVCLILQLMGKNEYYDDYNDGGAEGIYDQEEMSMLKRRRIRGTQPTKVGESLDSAPFREIEII